VRFLGVGIRGWPSVEEGPAARQRTATHGYDRSSLRNGEARPKCLSPGKAPSRPRMQSKEHVCQPPGIVHQAPGPFQNPRNPVPSGQRGGALEELRPLRMHKGTGTLCSRVGEGRRGRFRHPSGVRFFGSRNPGVAVGRRGRRPGSGRPPPAMIGHPSGMGGARPKCLSPDKTLRGITESQKNTYAGHRTSCTKCLALCRIPETPSRVARAAARWKNYGRSECTKGQALYAPRSAVPEEYKRTSVRDSSSLPLRRRVRANGWTR